MGGCCVNRSVEKWRGYFIVPWASEGGDPLTRKQLVQYGNPWWPMYILEDQEKRPANGRLKHDLAIHVVLPAPRAMG